MRLFSFIVVMVAGLALTASGQDQVMTASQPFTRAGRHFSFGIIEGAERLAGTTNSDIMLTVTSRYTGTGTVTSPSGYSTKFSFAPYTATVVELPDSLIHVNDLGKTSKGLIVTTTQPVNLVLHDSIPDAGDATQLYPDESMDHSYVVAEWGIWNDPMDQEDNRDEFIVTACQNEMQVTITPSVTTMLGQPAGVPFTIPLDRGECYIVKADSSCHPVTTSLSGSTISATGPVSVIVGTTCAYIPASVQACNELMDELLGKKWWGKHFFVEPLGNLDSTVVLVLTSDADFTATISPTNSSSSVLPSSGKRINTEFFGTAEIVTSVPVEVHQLCRGSNIADLGMSDPTMVTVLPVELYADTMIWNTPHLSPDPTVYAHWAPIVYPTAQAGNILLDGTPLSSIPLSKLSVPPEVIHGSTMSAINPSVQEGVHTLTSPVPVSVLSTGFAVADAYSFIPGTVGAEVQQGVAATSSSSLEVSVHPNPASDRLWITSNEPVASIQIFDPLGRAVKTGEPHSTEVAFSITDLPSGTYFLSVEAASGTRQRMQIVIVR